MLKLIKDVSEMHQNFDQLTSWGTGDEYEFHTVYIVRRPLNDHTLRLFNFNHWALKFEGM